MQHLRNADPVLVTGASGYVGPLLIPELARRGHAVRALARDRARSRVPDGVAVHRGDASSAMSRSLAARLPVMVCPRWIDTRAQPVAVGDVVAALAGLARLPDAPAEAPLRGPDPLVDGLRSEPVVEHPPVAGVDHRSRDVDTAVREAHAA